MKEKNIDFNDPFVGKRRARLAVPLILCAVILVGAFSFLAILIKNDFDFSRFLGLREAEEETSETAAVAETAAPAAPFSDPDAVNVLFYCHADGALSFMELISASEKENSIRVKPLAADGVYTKDGRSYTLAELYGKFGVSAVKNALAEKNCAVHRVAGFSETNFKRLMQKLGETVVNVPRDTEFRVNAITYSLAAGEQVLKPDTLLQYMKHAFSGDEKLKAEGAAMAAVLRTHLTADTIARGEDFFAGVVNLADTDISMFDFLEQRDALTAFLSAAPAVTVIS